MLVKETKYWGQLDETMQLTTLISKLWNKSPCTTAVKV